jgi:hypothetical protein
LGKDPPKEYSFPAALVLPFIFNNKRRVVIELTTADLSNPLQRERICQIQTKIPIKMNHLSLIRENTFRIFGSRFLGKRTNIPPSAVWKKFGKK